MRLGIAAAVLGIWAFVTTPAAATYLPPGLYPGLTLTAAPATPNFGSSFVITFGGFGAPAGTVVTVTEGSTTVATTTTAADEAAGSVTITVPTLPVGSHSLRGSWVEGYTTLYGDIALTVAPGNTHISIVQSEITSNVGDSVSFTATVAGDPGAAAFDEVGDIQFFDNANAIGAAIALANGSATFTSTELAAGSHTFTATYRGDASYAGSTSNPVLHQVVAATASSPATGDTSAAVPSGSSSTPATTNAAATSKKDDGGGCAVARSEHESTSSSLWLVGLALVFVTARRGRRR